MKEYFSAFHRFINISQILIGITVLLLGTSIYLTDRPPDQTYFVYKSFASISLHNTLPNLFGFIGNSLPSFVHVFCFILLTAGLLQCQKRGCIIVCASWFLINFIFELGQKFKPMFLKIIPSWFESLPILENAESYFLYGTFDFVDLFAITVGTVLAYFVLLNTNERKKGGWYEKSK